MVRFLRKAYAMMHRIKIDAYLDGLKNKGLNIGHGTSILEPFFLDPDHCFLISIGENCTLAPNVRLIAHDASTKLYLGYTRIGKIVIEDNCFIGDSTIILPNVTIGQNTIVGSGSIVNKSLPGNSVVAGSPAKVLCSLDEYLERVKTNADKKGVFGEDYHIDELSVERRNEILRVLGIGEGYIV